MENSITIKLDDATWKLFDEVHKETSLSNSLSMYLNTGS